MNTHYLYSLVLVGMGKNENSQRLYTFNPHGLSDFNTMIREFEVLEVFKNNDYSFNPIIVSLTIKSQKTNKNLLITLTQDDISNLTNLEIKNLLFKEIIEKISFL
jgi:hypothetical protein